MIVKVKDKPKTKERNLFSVKPAVDVTKNKKKKRKADQDEETIKKPKTGPKKDINLKFDSLTYHSLTEGQILLGCVREVRDYQLLVSLPHRLMGSVPLTHVSNAYTTLLKKVSEVNEDQDVENVHTMAELYKPGQCFVTKVFSISQINERNKVHLSILPEDINGSKDGTQLVKGAVLQCAVQSVEDNGFIMDCGIHNVRAAFLPKKHAPPSLGIIGVGTTLWCLIMKVKQSEDMSTFQLSLNADPQITAASVLPISETEVSLPYLSPGTIISTTVHEVLEEGLKLSLGDFKGVVSRMHLAQPFDQLSMYKPGQEVKARILFITPFTRVIHLSLTHSLCNSNVMSGTMNNMAVGQVLEAAEVYISTKSGVYLKLSTDCRGYCSCYFLKDGGEVENNVKKKFPVGSKHECRIVQYNQLDNLVIVALKKSILEQQVLGYQDIKIGEILNGTIKQYVNCGAIVAVSKSVDGFIPHIHITDTVMKNPQLKHPIGSKVKCRVLRVDPSRFLLHFTCKTQLVNSQLPIIQAFNNELIDTVTEGTIVRINKSGLLIELYARVKGFVPLRNISVEPVSDLSQMFHVGQVIKCKLMDVNPEEHRMTLSLIIEGLKPLGIKSKKTLENKNQCKARQQVNCLVTNVTPTVVIVTIEESELVAVIPLSHLSDDMSRCNEIIELIQPGDKICNALVFRNDASIITLSLKPSLWRWIKMADKDSLTSDQLTVGEIIPSVVDEIRSYGLMVLTAKGKLGQKLLLHVRNIMEEFIVDPISAGITVGQTWMVKCTGKSDKDRPELSSELSAVMNNCSLSSLDILNNYFHDEVIICNGLRLRGGKWKALAEFKIGEKVSAEVIEINDCGLLVKIDGTTISGVVPSDHMETDQDYTVGKQIVLSVLNVFFKEKSVQLTAKKEIIDVLHVKKRPIKVDKIVNGEVLIAQKEFVMVMLEGKYQGAVVYLPSQRHLNDLKGRHSLYKIGQSYEMVVKHSENGKDFAILKAHDKGDLVDMTFDRPSINFTVDGAELCQNKPNDEHSQQSDSMVEQESKELNTDALKVISKIRSISESSNITTEDATENDDNNNNNKSLTDEEMLKLLEEDKGTQHDDQMYKEELFKRRKQKKKECKQKKKRNLDQVNDDTEKSKVKQQVDGDDDAEKSKVKQPKTKKIKLDITEDSKKEKKKLTNLPDVESEVKKNKKTKKNKKNKKKDDPKVSKKECVELNTKGFVWDVPDEKETESASSSDDDDEEEDKNEVKQAKKKKKLSRSEQAAAAKADEKKLHEAELELRKGNTIPESALDYEALIITKPNSSPIWIQYISHHLENAEIDKAKSIAKRAIATINKEEEAEVLNIWMVLLRLEVQYGTPEETHATFKEATIVNCPLKVYTIMASVYEDSHKIQEAEKVYMDMTRKFKEYNDYTNVWIKTFVFMFKNGLLEKARKLLTKSLLTLPKKEHVDLINRFAQLEFRFGDPERGCTTFESLITNYPKRTDIWSVYADLLIKDKKPDKARHVLERMVGLKLKLHKMRFAFKKLLEFEKEHGTPQSVEAVKLRVGEFVNSALKTED